MLILVRILARLCDRSGFTLIEVLVAMITGVIVTGALFAILEVSVRQSSHLSNVAQATQTSRVTMTKIVDQIHSSCLYQGFWPVKEKSTPTKLILVNGYDEATGKEEPPAELPAAGIHKDEIEYVEAAHTLRDTHYTAETNVPVNGEYKWRANPTKVLLGEKVYAAEEVAKTPTIFKYYGYDTEANANTTEAASTLNEQSPLITTGELTKELALKVAAVQVTFKMGSPGKAEFKQTSASEKGLFAEQSTLNTFALMAPNSESEISAGPCE